MVTEVQHEISYYFPGTTSGIQRKAYSATQPQLRSENTPVTI